ncbi:MAG: histidinol-phosphatase [Bacteroidales bacterium]|nr:histidinol-phosphatase [Bacteroidales bacterium]
MKNKTNYHTHSNFSDGSAEPEEYIKEAIRQGFSSLGFSEHSVLPFENTFALQPGTESAYISEIRRLQQVYQGQVQILLALEADYIPGVSVGFAGLKASFGLDYIIGSVHLVKNNHNDILWFIDGPRRETYDNGLNELFGGDIRKGVTAYWHQLNQMIERETFDIVGHLDKIKMHNQGRWFSEEEGWYIDLVNETISLIADHSLIVEVNTRGLYKGRSESLFPGEYILRKLRESNVRVTLSSDAHQPHELSLWFDEAKAILKNCGFNELSIFSHGKWDDQSIDFYWPHTS